MNTLHAHNFTFFNICKRNKSFIMSSVYLPAYWCLLDVILSVNGSKNIIMQDRTVAHVHATVLTRFKLIYWKLTVIIQEVQLSALCYFRNFVMHKIYKKTLPDCHFTNMFLEISYWTFSFSFFWPQWPRITLNRYYRSNSPSIQLQQFWW